MTPIDAERRKEKGTVHRAEREGGTDGRGPRGHQTHESALHARKTETATGIRSIEDTGHETTTVGTGKTRTDREEEIELQMTLRPTKRLATNR